MQFSIGGHVFDDTSGVLTGPDGVVKFTPREARVLSMLARRAPQWVGRMALLDSMDEARPDAYDPKTLDVYIWRVRARLAKVGLKIETVWGRGYRLVETGGGVHGCCPTCGHALNAPEGRMAA